MKKSVAFLLAIVLCLALAVPIYAAGASGDLVANVVSPSPSASPSTMASPGTTNYTTTGAGTTTGTYGTYGTGTYNTYASPNATMGVSRGYGVDGVGRYNVNTYRTNAATTTNNNAAWGWLGLLGLLGLFGLRNRNDRRNEAK